MDHVNKEVKEENPEWCSPLIFITHSTHRLMDGWMGYKFVDCGIVTKILDGIFYVNKSHGYYYIHKFKGRAHHTYKLSTLSWNL